LLRVGFRRRRWRPRHRRTRSISPTGSRDRDEDDPDGDGWIQSEAPTRWLGSTKLLSLHNLRRLHRFRAPASAIKSHQSGLRVRSAMPARCWREGSTSAPARNRAVAPPESRQPSERAPYRLDGAAQGSDLPSDGLRRLTGFEGLCERAGERTNPLIQAALVLAQCAEVRSCR
jgi:hypothetical protein